jgi:hypothetical protein
MRVRSLVMLAAGALPQIATAAEMITYTYDAKGRVVKVLHSGSVNSGTTTTYDHDKADNRRRVVIMGAAR